MDVSEPWKMFAIAFVAAAAGGVGSLCSSDTPLTVRRLFGAILVHGCTGSGFGMIGYEFFNWRNRPWAIIGTAGLYGVGILSKEQIRTLVRRLFGFNGKGNTDVPKQ